jgi:hypothetical protein
MFSRWWWTLLDLQLQHLPGARRVRFHVAGGRSRTFSSDTSQGPAVDIFTLLLDDLGPSAFHVGGWRSQTFSSGTSRGPVVNVSTLMVGAIGP